MQLRQDLKLRQELTLQPQQILRSELIQLPILELELRVRSELETNPFLEEGQELEEIPGEPEEDEREAAVIAEEDTPELKEAKEEREVDWESILNDEDHYEYRSRSAPVEIMEIPRPAQTTLAEHLTEQLGYITLTDKQREIGDYIIGNINKDGYLDCSVDEIAMNLEAEKDEALKVLRIIQNFDPVGIGARDLRECLLLQLRAKDEYNPHAERLLAEYFEDFKNKRFEAIAASMEIDLSEVKEAFFEITRLNPKPGEGYFDERQNYVIPDLVVTMVGDEFMVYLNDGNIPNFYINSVYRSLMLQQKNTDKKVKEFLTRKLESARWFINAIHQRRSTMVRTMRAIVKKQEDFFRKGHGYLKPMILADIAEEINMDISTISRVTNGKYVQTDWGVFELKYFFSEKMATDNGEEVSTKVIKQKLREIVDSEDKKNPLSDQAIMEKLKDTGYNIARRTVQKYREQMRIPVKRLRREI